MLSIQDQFDEPLQPLDFAESQRLSYPCSRVQQRFWFEEQLHPGNPRLNVACRWRLDGELEHTILEAAWRCLIARHEALRTRLETVDGEPIQIVEPHVPFSIPIFDLRGLPENDVEPEAERLALVEALHPLDITVAPLLRVRRIIVSDSRSILMVTSHHTVCDAWSFGLLARELGELCDQMQRGEPAKLPEIPLTYGQFAVAQRAWLQSYSLQSEIALVRKKFADFRQFELQTDYPRRRIQSSNSLIASRILDPSVSSSLAALARRHGCTMFMASVAVLMTLLHRYTGETTITLGTQVSGRDDVDLEDIVGCFIDTVALHGDLSGDPTFLDVLERVSDTVTQAFDLRHFPLERLIEIINPKRDLSRNTLFSINFTLYRAFVRDTAYERFSVSDMPSRSAGAIYDLSFFMVERPSGLRISCEYNTDLFDGETVGGIIERFERLLEGIIPNPQERISRIPMLTETDRNQLVYALNDTQSTYCADRTVPQLFADQARNKPNAVAVVCGDIQLSYAEIEAASNQLARELVRRGFTSGSRIGILLERSPQLVVSLLAVLKAGAAYVPLDPAYPPERLAFIIGDAELSAVLTRSRFSDRMQGQTPIVSIDAEASGIRSNPSEALDTRPSARDLAHLIYTSGSTGRPKGVEIEHGSLINVLAAISVRPGIDSNDVLVAVSTISFDIAGLEIFLPLINGARLVIADEFEVVDAAALIALMRRSDATILQATPVTWQMLVEAGWTGEPPVKMLCGGEVLSRKLADALLERGGELWNLYGPTETTIYSSATRVTRTKGPVLMGPPIANTQLYVLDSNGELVPPGVPGELYIGGDGVARGYFRRPDLTRERFVPDRFRNVPGGRLYRTGDIVRRRGPGCFEFLGRADQQTKLRGFRIELGEIEATLLQQPDVREAAAVVRESDAGEKALWAFVVPRDDVSKFRADWLVNLRSRLATFLPQYMVPAPIVVLDALPQTPNGKIDRQALVHGEHLGLISASEQPRDSTEAILAGLVDGIIGRPGTARHDDIFALGFHSLLAVRLIRSIAQTFGVELPLRTLFDEPTVAALARRIQLASEQGAVGGVLPIAALNAQGTRPPFTYFHSDVLAEGLYCRRLAAFVGADQPIYAVAPHGTQGLRIEEPTIEAMAQDYLPRLRRVQPKGPYRLGGFCAGGLVAFELARLLRAEGETVDRLLLINSSPSSKGCIPAADRLIHSIGRNQRLSPGLRESLCYNLARFADAFLEPRNLLRFLRDRVSRLLARRKATPMIDMADFQPFKKRKGTRETENYFAHLVASLTYHPKSYDGDLTLIWSTDQRSMKDIGRDWKRLASSVRIISMAGGHVSALHDRIEDLGNVLSDLLR